MVRANDDNVRLEASADDYADDYDDDGDYAEDEYARQDDGEEVCLTPFIILLPILEWIEIIFNFFFVVVCKLCFFF